MNATPWVLGVVTAGLAVGWTVRTSIAWEHGHYGLAVVGIAVAVLCLVASILNLAAAADQLRKAVDA